MEEKAKRIMITKEFTQNNEELSVNQTSDKTKDQITHEKAIKCANSVYAIMRDAPRNLIDADPKTFILVADRYLREDFEGLSEADLIGKEDKRKREGELTTEEIRRWRCLNRGDAVYCLDSESYEILKRRFEHDRQVQNPNYEEIRRPVRGYRGDMHPSRSRHSVSPQSSSRLRREHSNQDVRDARRRERNSRSRSRSPR